MNVLGIRCSASDFSYVVLQGTQQNPILLKYETVRFPKSYSKPQSLKWFLQEVQELIVNNNIKKISIKGFEGMTKGKSYETRVEYEAMVILASANLNVKPVTRKIKSTIAKDLGLKGRAKYLKSLPTSTLFKEFESYSENEKDAILVGLSELNQ